MEEEADLVQLARTVYEGRWPMYCRTCNGWGYKDVGGYISLHNSIGFSPFGEDCPDCLGRGLCPRCGEYIDEYGMPEEYCFFCGWEATDGGVPNEAGGGLDTKKDDGVWF